MRAEIFRGICTDASIYVSRMDYLLQEIEKLKAERPGITQAEIADLLGVKQPMVNRWLRGGKPSADSLVKVLEKRGWNLGRARPEYDPAKELTAERRDLIRKVREAAASYGATRPPVFDNGPAAKPKPVKVTSEPTPETLSRDVIELRAMLEDIKSRTLRPEGQAPRAALHIEATGEIILDPAAPLESKRRAITSAAGLEESLELTHPGAMLATKGPLIIARSDAPATPEVLRFLREPRDPSPRPGIVSVLPRTDDPNHLALRRLAAVTGSDSLLAEGLAPGHDNFLVNPATTTMVAILIARLP